jgi:hypothetical protein
MDSKSFKNKQMKMLVTTANGNKNGIDMNLKLNWNSIQKIASEPRPESSKTSTMAASFNLIYIQYLKSIKHSHNLQKKKC